MTERKLRDYALYFVAAAVLAAAAIAIFESMSSSIRYSAPWTDADSRQLRSKEYIVAERIKHATEAGEKALQVIEQRTHEFESRIKNYKAGAPKFAESIASWEGRWRGFQPYIPGADKDAHRKFVEKKFADHVVSTKALGEEVRRSIEDTARDLDAVENDLALALRKELLGRPLSNEETLVAPDEFRKAMERLAAASAWDAHKAAGRLLASETATIGTAVLVRLGVSAGIVAAGAANSWWTLGGALIVGLVVERVWAWLDDPQADIERAIASAIDKLATDGARAIRTELRTHVETRTDLWTMRAAEIEP